LFFKKYYPKKTVDKFASRPYSISYYKKYSEIFIKTQ